MRFSNAWRLARRHAALAALLAAGLVPPASALAATPACEGLVYADTNANGRRDTGEAPLPGQRGAGVVERTGMIGVEAEHPGERLERLRGAAVIQQRAA